MAARGSILGRKQEEAIAALLTQRHVEEARTVKKLVEYRNTRGIWTEFLRAVGLSGFADCRDPQHQTKQELHKHTELPDTKIGSHRPELTHKNIVGSCPSIRLSTLSANTQK